MQIILAHGYQIYLIIMLIRLMAWLLACPAHYEYYWGAGGLSSYMHSYCTIKTNSYSDPTFSGKILRGYTILANGMNTSASLYSPFHSHLIVDITGY